MVPPGAIPGSGAATPHGSPTPSASADQAVRAPVLEPGSHLGKYRIEGVLGHGAYGTVYRALDPDLGETVALKALGTFGDPEALRSALAAEFKVQRKIKDKEHLLESYPPVQVEAHGLNWVLLPMELGEGTLRGWLEEKGAEEEHLAEGLALLRQAVGGLRALHVAGLVHRDVKPENVLLVKEGEGKKAKRVAKVADFGLAGSLEKLASERPELVGDGVGTPAYMAPEQVMAAHWKDVGPAADAYAIGTMLFEMLDGERPYSGDGMALRAKKRDQALRPRRPEGPAHLAELALGLLAHEAKVRPTLEQAENELVEVTPEERAAWGKAKKADTEESYEEYLKEYPEGVWAAEGGESLMKLEASRIEAEEEVKAERKAKEEAEREAKEAAQRAAETPWGDLASLGLGEGEFVRIPAGTFMMGGPLLSDGPEHRVRITRDFLLQKTPVTQAQWKAVTGENPSSFTGDDRRPVDSVSWEDAKAFINKVNGKVTPGTFRLPTEAEWEYACRAGTTGDYGGTGRPEDMGWYYDNSEITTHPVAQKLPNAWGLYDMHGNVWEWCEDWFDLHYYARSPEVDPPGPGNGEDRVLRGGTWNQGAFDACSAGRHRVDPAYSDWETGFRLARTV